MEDRLIQRGVILDLILVGEAASRVSAETRQRHPVVPWARVVAFRNVAVHQYFGIDLHPVWNAATENAAALREQITSILNTDFNG